MNDKFQISLLDVSLGFIWAGVVILATIAFFGVILTASVPVWMARLATPSLRRVLP